MSSSEQKKKNKMTKLLSTTSLSDIVQINKWWEQPAEEGEEDDFRWKHLEHNGVLFPPSYTPHSVKLKYKNEEISLTPEQEEIATFWAQILDNDLSKKDIAIKNFSFEFKKVLPDKYKNANFADFDFSLIKNYLDEQKEAKKNKSQDEKKLEKSKKQKLMDFYGWALVDGSLEKLSNFLVEPPGIFRGRGEQPLSGKLKSRIYPENITINCGMDDPVPVCTINGHSWGEVVNNNEATWLAYYKIGKNTKYVFLAPNSKFKGMSDYKKYEKAKKLKNCIENIRNDYIKKFDDKNTKNNQLGVATYLIDRLALRVGNEKNEEEAADTVGCCTLRVEHITLEKDNYITFDFLAKDSMRYLNKVQIDSKVYDLLNKFIKGKEPSDNLFDLIDAQKLNDYLKSLMDGLSAKVFRTYNASFVLQQQLELKQFNIDDPIDDKVSYYNSANKRVAKLCNHQRTVPKNFDDKSQQMENELNDYKQYLNELDDYVKNFKKNKNKYHDSVVGKLKKIFPLDKNKAEKTLIKLKDKVKTMDKKLNERKGNKEIALGTSKLNYMDPRITVSWCKKYEVPIERVFTKSIRDKFPWAMYTGPDYKF